MDVVFFLSVFAAALLLAFLVSFVLLRPSRLVTRSQIKINKKADYKFLFQYNFRLIGSIFLVGICLDSGDSRYFTLQIIILALMALETLREPRP